MDNVKILLVDMDGVVADFDARIAELLRAENLPGVTDELIDAEVLNRTRYKINHPLIKDAAREIMLRPGFFGSLDVVPGAVDSIAMLAAVYPQLKIFFCSTPVKGSAYCHREKIEWVVEHFGAHWESRVILTRDKSLIYGNVLLDDRPDPMGSALSVPFWEHVVFDRPYNREVQQKRRAATWKEVETLMHRLFKPAVT